MVGCVCWVSENVTILNDTFNCKNIPILNGTFLQFIPNLMVISRWNYCPIDIIYSPLSHINLVHLYIVWIQSWHFCIHFYTIHLKSPTHMEWGRFHTHIEWHLLIHFIHLKPKKDPYPSLSDTHIRAWLIPSPPPPGVLLPPPTPTPWYPNPNPYPYPQTRYPIAPTPMPPSMLNDISQHPHTPTPTSCYHDELTLLVVPPRVTLT